ncbi:hypothetical protein DFP72DRAFT_845569 [Ephemerocybe angulata]|uniref:COP9 signalosome complex subunit 3 n=1 Tax=Ephemerocybe angulata TaxID=980116 RepID=A0A8H6M978_9AGAR|nr:hypothetical protein DFP72DRAFT_845569 [Tulosesus angulatus]
MAPTDPTQVMDTILQQVTTADSLIAVANFLKNMNPKDLREAALASPLSTGQDPLLLLSIPQNTLTVLYILTARLAVNNGQAAPTFETLENFCRTFDPEQARLSPDRVTLLAKGIQRLAVSTNNPRSAILPLHFLVTRYAPDPSYLTTIHPIFTVTCLQATHPSAALPVLNNPITSIDTNLSDLTYNDNLIYHYTGGVALAMLKRWAEAEEFFEICVSAPGAVPAALQLEALKKLKLVQLIAKGKTAPLPKYTNQLLLRHFKATPYHQFVNAYPHNVEALREILSKERNLFQSEKNVGLLRQALDRAPRWALKKLTATYLSLNLADIGKAVRISDEGEVRALLLDMIESGDISAAISADGSVTFSDPPPQFTRAQVDEVLKNVQEQSELLEYLEKEMARSKDFLSKAIKGRDDTVGFIGADEDVFSQIAPHGAGIWGIDD